MWYVVVLDGRNSSSLTNLKDVADAHTVLFKSEDVGEAEAFSKGPKNKRFRYYEGYSFRYDEKENIWECVGVPKKKAVSYASVTHIEPKEYIDINCFIAAVRTKDYSVKLKQPETFEERYDYYLKLDNVICDEYDGNMLDKSLWKDERAIETLKNAMDSRFTEGKSVKIEAMDEFFFNWSTYEKALKEAYPKWEVNKLAFIKAAYEGLCKLEELYKEGVAENIIDDNEVCTKSLTVHKIPKGCCSGVVQCMLINNTDTGYELALDLVLNPSSGSYSYDWTEEERDKYKVKCETTTKESEDNKPRMANHTVLPVFGTDEFWDLFEKELSPFIDWWNSDIYNEADPPKVMDYDFYSKSQRVVIEAITDIVANSHLNHTSVDLIDVHNCVFGELFTGYMSEHDTINYSLTEHYGFVNHWNALTKDSSIQFVTIYSKTDEQIIVIDYENNHRHYIDDSGINTY